MDRNIPRIMIAGTGSNCGKTTITCGILQALVDRNLKVSSFKCGPDYIDPMFHSKIIGTKSNNLDLYFMGENTAKYLLSQNSEDSDIAVIEGVMGFYDGLGISTTTSSSHDLSSVTTTPVILVVDVKGMGLSALATVKGFLDFRKENMIKAVIFNRCSPHLYNSLRKLVIREFGGRISVLGYLPNLPDIHIGSRHLGLVTADEITDLKKKMGILSSYIKKSVDIGRILELSEKYSQIKYENISIPKEKQGIKIAVAKDRAFCFYYNDNINLLEKMGSEIVYFSPMVDKKLPDDVQGLYIGGGYPELYAKTLSENKSILEDIKEKLEEKLPCIAECGGYMYLCQSIGSYPMVGYLKGRCFDTGKLNRFGYVTLTAKKDNILCKKGDSIRGHEFHYWDSDMTGEDFKAEKFSGLSWDCVVANEHMYAGFPHFHFYSNINFVSNFYQKCIDFNMSN